MKQKTFFYKGKNYINADFTETYKRESRRIRIDYTPAGNPFFRHNNRRYYLDNFMRIDHGTEIEAADGEKVTLCGYEADQYYTPLFIELDEAGESCRVYRYEGSETNY